MRGVVLSSLAARRLTPCSFPLSITREYHLDDSIGSYIPRVVHDAGVGAQPQVMPSLECCIVPCPSQPADCFPLFKSLAFIGPLEVTGPGIVLLPLMT